MAYYVDSTAALKAGVAFETMLLEPILQPIAGQADSLGAYGIGLLAQRIAEQDTHGFAALIAARLEKVS
jgi:hypothetical protein